MKLYKLLILTIVGSVWVAGCDDTDNLATGPLQGDARVYLDPGNVTTVGEGAVAQSTADGEISTTDNTFEIKVLRTGNDFSDEVTVNYEFTAVYTSTNDFVNEGDDASDDIEFSTDGTITIPANSQEGSVRIAVSDDVLSNGNRTISVSLTGVSGGYDLGFSDADPKTDITITLEDDDCPIDVENDWEGTYLLTEEFTAGVNEGFSFFSGQTVLVDMELDPSDPSLTSVFLSDNEDTDFGFMGSDPNSLKFNTCPVTVSIDNDEVFGFTALGGGATSLVQSSGTYNESNNTITLVGDLIEPGANFGEYTITLTKQAD